MAGQGGRMGEVMRQAARMQRKIDQVKSECGDKEVSATAGNDKVVATATYAGKLARLEIDPAFLEQEGLEFALDAACAATNAALDLATKAMEAEINTAQGGLKLPNF